MPLALLIAILGLLIYVIAANVKAPNSLSVCIAEIGRISFFAGLFVYLLQTGPATISRLLHN